MEDCLRAIYEDYFNVVDKYIDEYIVLTNKFPAGVLNEIRAIFTHLARAYTAQLEKDEKEIKDQYDKAKKHMSRAKRDCYKYYCMAIERQYQDFLKVINTQDIKVANIKEIYNLHEKANRLLFVAREYETTENRNEEKLYEHYNAARQAFEELYMMIREIK